MPKECDIPQEWVDKVHLTPNPIFKSGFPRLWSGVMLQSDLVSDITIRKIKHSLEQKACIVWEREGGLQITTGMHIPKSEEHYLTHEEWKNRGQYYLSFFGNHFRLSPGQMEEENKEHVRLILCTMKRFMPDMRPYKGGLDA